MSCAYLHAHPADEAASVFTVHNLAFQGLFPHDDWALLGLSSRYMSPSALEFHGQLSFMKAGLKFADRVTTVSPSYAREIATPEFGVGLEGVIRGRGADVSGILNGIDTRVWDPAADTALPQRYSAQQMQGKAQCKAALQQHFGLAVEAGTPLLGVVSRLTSQKGLDLVLSVLPEIMRMGGQLVVQGTGEASLEAAFRMAADAHPGRVGVLLGYDENAAHRLIAGADMILVPSRFEPCGLTQMYGLRYGTVPIVRRVGGPGRHGARCRCRRRATASSSTSPSRRHCRRPSRAPSSCTGSVRPGHGWCSAAWARTCRGTARRSSTWPCTNNSATERRDKRHMPLD